MKNFVIDFHRRKRWRETPIGGLNDLDEIAGADKNPGALEKLETRALRRRGIQAWARLPSPRDRFLICSKYHRGSSNERLAAVLDLNQNALRQALFNAQKRYMSIVKDLAPEFFPKMV